MQLHKLRNDESREKDGEPVHLTPAGIARLEKELANLKQRLPTLAGETARTAAYGDRSDNAEYKQAKGALRFTHRRIFEIEQQLKRAVAIPSGPSATGTVQLGSTVVLESNETLKTYEIVGPAETDPAHGRISHQSPLGAALIGHAKGDVIEIKMAGGSNGKVTGNNGQEYRIIDIR
jgi:transcription elongation factor GreA